MQMSEFGIGDVEAYIEQELPGFKPRLMESAFGDGGYKLEVRAHIQFGLMGEIPGEVVYPLPRHSRDLQLLIEQLIRQTREGAIQKLGLQKEIDRVVENQVRAQVAQIRQEEFQKAYSKAAADFARGSAEAEGDRAKRMWNAFMGRDET